MKINVIDIIDFLKTDILNVFGCVDNAAIKHIRAPQFVDKDTLDWVNSNKKEKQLIAESSKAKIIIVDKGVKYSETLKLQNKIIIQVENPKLVIALIAGKFFTPKFISSIHKSSFIHKDAKIHSSVYIGPNCTIGNCIIGENTIIYSNVTIYDDVKIGSNVIIQAGTVIGTDGLGCDRKKDGTLVKFPHFGIVEICDNVEIGANCQIARGALSNTIIGEGSKINGLCFIAHNCVLGKNVLITGSTMLAGSVKIEDNVTIYSKVIIRDQIIIGKGATIGMGAVVTKNIPLNEIWIGSPAKKINNG